MTMAAPLSLAGVMLYTPDDANTTMGYMARLVRRALLDPYVVRRANEVIGAEGARDYPAQVDAIRQYLLAHFKFVDNPIGTQRIQPPAFLLHDIDARGFTQGACDDAAVLVAALAMANGLPAEFTAYAFGHATGHPAVDNQVPFTHVIAHVFDGQQWDMLDVTRPADLYRLPDVVRTLAYDLEAA